MQPEPAMPGYFELLSMADFAGSQFTVLDHVKGAGILGVLAMLAVIASWLLLIGGLASRVRVVLTMALMSAFAAILLGWGGSYMGYLAASRVVAASRTTPKDADLAVGATHMLMSGMVPSVGAFLPLLIALTVLPFLGRTPK